MSVLKIDDPAHITLPEDIGERLGLKPGDIVLISIEAERVILEKRGTSPVDESFGIWADVADGPAYVNKLRDEWEERFPEPPKHGSPSHRQ